MPFSFPRSAKGIRTDPLSLAFGSSPTVPSEIEIQRTVRIDYVYIFVLVLLLLLLLLLGDTGVPKYQCVRSTGRETFR